ncbi:hypothetical protein F5Y15DRAFT_197323 [Xylariaceae sp. FL0016]|nr:hypothetical protein F5Y15DRAFT_197323 [Xylariaceae sp. FL0016]
MPRTLPWKRGRKEESPSPLRKPKVEYDESDINGLSSLSSPVVVTRCKSAENTRRSKSTSPPPEPLEESFMVEGASDDDRYRMVEDEFVATAQLFTAHLHAAEYHRLKTAAKSGSSGAIDDFSKPVIGNMSRLVKIKQERQARLERQKLATKAARANRKRTHSYLEDSDSDSIHQRDQSLHGLMESPRKEAARLDSLTTRTASTRAAAGFTRSQGSEMPPVSQLSYKDTSNRNARNPPSEHADLDRKRDEDDRIIKDLSRVRSRVPTVTPVKAQSLKPLTPTVPLDTAGPSVARSSSLSKRREGTMSMEKMEDRISSDEGRPDFMSRLKRQQADRRRSRDQRRPTETKSKPKLDDDIPGFL